MADTDSLVLTGVGELMLAAQARSGPGVPFLGTMDGGAPQPLTTSQLQLLLDGSIVKGRQSDNRQIQLQLIVIGTPSERAAGIGPIVAVVDDQRGEGYTLVYTPEDTHDYPVAFDCARGSVVEDYTQRDLDLSVYNLTIPAFPFTRTTQPLVLTPGTSQQVLNAMDTTTGITASAGLTVATTADHVEGSAAITSTLGGTSTAPPTGSGWVVAQQTLGAAVNLSALDIVEVRAKFTITSTVLHRAPLYANELTLRLTDAAGKSQLFPMSYLNNWLSSAVKQNSYGTLQALIQGAGVTVSIDLVHVKGWALIWNPWWSSNDVTFTQSAPAFVFYADNLVARTSSYAATSSGLYRFVGVPGMFRTPVKVDVVGTSPTTHVFHHNPDAQPGYDPIGALLSGGSLLSNALRVAAYPGTHLIVVDAVSITQPVGPTPPQPVKITVTATQGGRTRSVSRTWAASALAGITTLPLWVIGTLDLPVSAVTDENAAATFTLTVTVTVTSGGSGTVGKILAFSMADGCTTIIANSDGANRNFYIDPATPQGLSGRVFCGASRATAVHTSHRGDGSIHFTPGLNVLAAYGAGAAMPSGLVATLYPRFLSLDRPKIAALDAA